LHGAFRCAGDDRWVAIAAWDDEDLERLVKVAGNDIALWCADRSPLEVAEILQGTGVEAVPVQDFADSHDDPQLGHRGHFERLTGAVGELPQPALDAGQARVRIVAAAVNFPDVLVVANRYQVSVPPPFVPGSEFAGTVEAVADDVSTISVGDRVFGTGLVGA